MPASPPRRPWPEPVQLLNRLDFDYAPKPVIAGGIVCIASSSDHTVRAFDAASGRERWHFISGG
ncbi:MAG: PQQ-binding-like beta-propeller repeat protein, partial [Planctomycetota bacterium]|nr:PQQ-binding-like beta-propeller repeat protein [Planctomycetota bacterium]